MHNPPKSNLVSRLLTIVIVTTFAAYPFFNHPDKVDEDQQDEIAAETNIVYENEHLPDFSAISDVREKKKAFFSYLQPLVEQVNYEIEQQRDFILNLDKMPVSKNEKARLAKILKRYDVSSELSFAEMKKRLLRRADTLPVALVLMQAANESAWGTSRFALEANNLFGQWCFKKGCGVIPTGRPEGQTYEVRLFKHPIASIRSYFNNLNTGHAYVSLRSVREQQRNQQEELDPSMLATGLLKYSIRREAYVEEIQTMIRVNNKYID